MLNWEDGRKNIPVLLAHDLGLAPLLSLDVLRAPRLHEVVVVLAAQLLLCMGVSKANLNCSMITTHVDVVAHGDGSSRGMDVLIALGGDVCVARCCAHKAAESERRE